MVDRISSDAAQIVGLFVEAVLYGVHLVSLGFVLFYILYVGSPRRWRWPSGIRAATFIVAIILAINSTLNLSLGLTRMIQAYVYKVQPQKTTWINLAKPYTVTIQTLIADSILTYRCWVVYGNSWIVALFPIALSTSSLAIFTWITVIQTRIYSQLGTVTLQVKASHALVPLFIAQFALTNTLNVYATSVIVYRIAKMERATSRLTSTQQLSEPPQGRRKRPSQLQRVARIIVDSAIIYTAASVMTFASYKSNVQYITSAVDIIAVGIAFNMIIIRLGIERSRAQKDRSHEKLTTLKFGTNEPAHIRSSDTIPLSLASNLSPSKSASINMSLEKIEERV